MNKRDRRDNVKVRYNAKKDDKVSRSANVQNISGAAVDARGLVNFHNNE